jgi:hypothetical protein
MPVLLAGLSLFTACRASAPDPRATRGAQSADASSRASGATTVAPPAQPATVPHGDHNPHHGGMVLMKGDLHYEVVVDESGREHRLYFSDAVREDLPASVASRASLTIRRDDEPEETIPLQIDNTGESWIGSGRAVPGLGSGRAKATVRVAFTVANDPYWIEVPLP